MKAMFKETMDMNPFTTSVESKYKWVKRLWPKQVTEKKLLIIFLNQWIGSPCSGLLMLLLLLLFLYWCFFCSHSFSYRIEEVKIYFGWLANYLYFYTAHSLIRNIRRKIKHLSSNTTIVKSNISLIREQVATILYIIQEFYSNTNWVELHGSSIYGDFGEVLFLNSVDTISNQI